MDEQELDYDGFIIAMLRRLLVFKYDSDTCGRHEFFGDWKQDFDNWVMRNEKEAE